MQVCVRLLDMLRCLCFVPRCLQLVDSIAAADRCIPSWLCQVLLHALWLLLLIHVLCHFVAFVYGRILRSGSDKERQRWTWF